MNHLFRFLFIIGLACPVYVHGQTDSLRYLQNKYNNGQSDSTLSIQKRMNEGPKEIGYIIMEEMPVFPGGNEALSSYFKENIKLPPNWPPDSITGKVYITFFIDTGGNVNDVKALRGINPILDSIAVAAAQKMPKWIPARLRGMSVGCQWNYPVKFGTEKFEIKEVNKENKME